MATLCFIIAIIESMGFLYNDPFIMLNQAKYAGNRKRAKIQLHKPIELRLNEAGGKSKQTAKSICPIDYLNVLREKVNYGIFYLLICIICKAY